MSHADELLKLTQLHQAGSLTDEEFASAKAKLLDDSAGLESSRTSLEHSKEAKMWGLFLHLSQFLGHFSLLGYAAPIVIWQIKKDELPELDAHGKNVVNWMISLLIYLCVSAVLIVVIIGIPMLIVLGVLAIIFPIIGALKANNGEVWRYPLSISFFK